MSDLSERIYLMTSYRHPSNELPGTCPETAVRLAEDYDALSATLAATREELDGARDMLSICDACAATDHQRAAAAEQQLERTWKVLRFLVSELKDEPDIAIYGAYKQARAFLANGGEG